MPKAVFFGGTFNPPHISHRLMLECAAALPEVETVLVVPTNIPPHKALGRFMASGADRLRMCSLLCEGVEKAVVSDIELKRGGKSYSVDTLTELNLMYGDLYMLIGGDMVTTFNRWYRYKDILKLCTLLAVRRKGVDNVEFDRAVDGIICDGGAVTVIDTVLPKVSSTELRERLKNSDPEGLLIPQNIKEYIYLNGLYRGEKQ